MGNVNDDIREGYGISGGLVARNTAMLPAGVSIDGNLNDLERESNGLSGTDEVKKIIDIT